ncbi:hypothetical protein [Acaryochloris sp. CCMEE 5410]|uniref:hypothetical protein n=1 Tax=Acaryochloris sp. CCMEE 5410 TaxID=310037 RepID=UPI0011122244|nr:hypothetical protein [Acaryochloris sp. CCMEE 5410]
MNKLLESDLDMARKILPTAIYNQFAQDYPDQVISAAEFASVTPLPDGYKAEILEVYGGLSAEPAIVFHDDELVDGDFSIFEITNDVIGIDVDGTPRYSEIQGEILLNTLGGLVLPTEIAAAEGVLNMMIKDLVLPELPEE